MYESDRKGITSKCKEAVGFNMEDSPLVKANEDYGEIVDIFPSLKKYKEEHNTANLQKLMVEILEFCQSVYASTQNEAERKIYHSMIKKLNN